MIAFRLINPPWTFVSWVAAASGMWGKNKMAIMPAKEWGNPSDIVKTRLRASLWSTASWLLLERDMAEPLCKSAAGPFFSFAYFSKPLTSSSKGPGLQCTLGFHSSSNDVAWVNVPVAGSCAWLLSGDLAVFQLLPVTSADIPSDSSCALRWTHRVRRQYTQISLNVDECFM